MRLLDRYLLRELLVPLGYCLCGFLIILIAFDMVFQLHVYQENRLLADAFCKPLPAENKM